MALIKCPECGRDISDRAAACIHCGCPLPAATPASAPAPSAPRSLSVNFNAALYGPENGKTSQTIYVTELGRNVEFSIDNSTKVGDTYKITLREGSKYEYILFTAVSVSNIPNASSVAASSSAPTAAPVRTTPSASAPVRTSPSASAPSNQKAVTLMKSYNPNWIVNYVHSRRFFTIMFLCFGLVGKLAADGDMEMAFTGLAVTAPLWLSSLLARIFYPMHHVKKYIRKHGLEDAIRNDGGYMNVAISAYNAMPGKKMLNYIRDLNPAAAKTIEQQLASKKK